MTAIADMSRDTLLGLQAELRKELDLQKANQLSLDLTRGKPAADQLDLSSGLDDVLGGNYFASDGTDARNYGALTGIPEAKELGAELMGVDPQQVICWGNSSLTLMQLTVDLAMHGSLWGDTRRWSNSAGPKILAPVPGYDRHFTISERANVQMVNVPMTDSGPDMARVAELAADDPDIKGIWCVPKYSNPTGCIYTPECVAALAELPRTAAAEDFVVLWDNAYAVHDLDTPRSLTPILPVAQRLGTEDHIVLFASTSKITYPSGGLGFMASGATILAQFSEQLGTLSIGPDKVNQLRHARFLGGRLIAHMADHAELLRPKFALVEQVLREQLGNLGIAQWTTPAGGYFVSLDAPQGTAKRVGQLAASVGLSITKPGATFPYGIDPQDSNLRIAPTFATLEDLDIAMQVLTLCVKLAAVEQQLEQTLERT